MAKIPSVGIFPPSFPRDPVEVNVFLEHVLVGQVLQPLVDSGPDGGLIPGAASRWEFLPDAKTLKFSFDGKAKFSTGAPVTAKDAKYTIERHIKSNHSQSKPYLKRILKIEIEKDQLVLRLGSPYIAILHALSRDHLGIVPFGWKFEAGSGEPLIGSGAYRVMRGSEGFHLKLNPHSREAANVRVPEWRVVLQSQPLELPDLAFYVTSDLSGKLKTLPGWNAKNFSEDEVTHFMQSSAWWYPYGKSFEDEARKHLGMCAFEALISERAKDLGLRRATGVIPAGIAGHIPENHKFRILQCDSIPDVRNRKYKVAVIGREFAMLSGPSVSQVEKKFQVKFDLLPIEGPEIPKLKESKPDIFFFAYAGGFHDPEGFLTVVTGILSTEPKTIFQKDYDLYMTASSQSDWQQRSQQYQTINRQLVERRAVVPGWRVPMTRIRCRNLILQGGDLRYSPKLKDYELSDKEVTCPSI